MLVTRVLYVRQRRRGKSSVKVNEREKEGEVAGKHNWVVPSAGIVRTGEYLSMMIREADDDEQSTL